ncbi:hypothetical protein PENVUL_c043G06397 [Penicillium vulpinum]|uniref:Xylanolytic transcriptional activator regulatory domain-containing protein n=2 Tax=Penicillium vulpinum TaxID=29845 RepID=A0A1V6RIC4_9EURO|nr:hypothetical protein PENVUL_c043G06397 [Penicillium vulpinum]
MDWFEQLPKGWQRERQENFNKITTGSPTSVDMVSDSWTSTLREMPELFGGATGDESSEDHALKIQLQDMKKMESLRLRIENVVKDKKTAEALKPWYNLYCKRPCFHDEYLEAFNKPNVELIDSAGAGVEAVTERGIIVQGKEYPVDCIIYATGYEWGGNYDAGNSKINIEGRNGQTLVEKFKDGPLLVHGCWIRGFPNLSLLSWTQAGTTANGTTTMIKMTEHMIYLQKEFRKRQIRSIEPGQNMEDIWDKQITKSLTPESADGIDSLTDDDANVSLETDSLHVRRAILDIFWTSNELWSNIVDKEQFLASKVGGQASEYYSPSLEDAMLACGSRNSTSSVIRKAGRIYVNRAKEGLLTQVETLSIAAIQKLLLVSNFEAGDGYHRIGWTYCGIALQMLFDLGIHEDCSVLVAQGHLTIREAACRRRLLLSAFLYDTIWAWFMGRPRSVPVSSVILAHSNHSEDLQCDTSALILDAWVDLCILMAEAGDILNLSVSLDDPVVERLSQIYTSVDRLLDTLPDDLAWHSSEMSPLHPSAYGLHTQISAFKMLLLRLPTRSRHPMNSFDIIEKNRVTLKGFTSETSDAAIYENAVRIVRLVHLLIQVHGIEQIVPTILDNIYIAAIILIQHISNAQQLRTQESLSAIENDKNLLDILSKTLAGAEKHYRMTAVLGKNLCSIVRGMNLAGLFRSDNGDEENVTDQSASAGSELAPDQTQHPSDVENPILASDDHFMNSSAFEFTPNLMTGIEQYQGATTDAFPWPLSPVV